MRIELFYSHGSDSYKKTLNQLEYIIAEEQWPLPVELIALPRQENPSPAIRIDGELLLGGFERSQSCIEQIREILCAKWRDLTVNSICAL